MNVAQIDINDDTIDKYIVWHYRFDETTSHFKRMPLAAFSTPREAKKLFKIESGNLQKRKNAGLADVREYISSDQMVRGHKASARQMRTFLRKIKSNRRKSEI
jgi:hypothetical protein